MALLSLIFIIFSNSNINPIQEHQLCAHTEGFCILNTGEQLCVNLEGSMNQKPLLNSQLLDWYLARLRALAGNQLPSRSMTPVSQLQRDEELLKHILEAGVAQTSISPMTERAGTQPVRRVLLVIYGVSLVGLALLISLCFR